MAREEKCILTNMCMIYDGSRILVQDRKDPSQPGITFPGELMSSDEGEVFWIERENLSKYVQVDGFEHMLEIFENDDLSENYWWSEDGKFNRDSTER